MGQRAQSRCVCSESVVGVATLASSEMQLQTCLATSKCLEVVICSFRRRTGCPSCVTSQIRFSLHQGVESNPSPTPTRLDGARKCVGWSTSRPPRYRGCCQPPRALVYGVCTEGGDWFQRAIRVSVQHGKTSAPEGATIEPAEAGNNHRLASFTAALNSHRRQHRELLLLGCRNPGPINLPSACTGNDSPLVLVQPRISNPWAAHRP